MRGAQGQRASTAGRLRRWLSLAVSYATMETKRNQSNLPFTIAILKAL